MTDAAERGYPTQRQPDTTLAQAQLGGWAPTIELEEGLRRTIAYFAERLEISPVDPGDVRAAAPLAPANPL